MVIKQAFGCSLGLDCVIMVHPLPVMLVFHVGAGLCFGCSTSDPSTCVLMCLGKQWRCSEC